MSYCKTLIISPPTLDIVNVKGGSIIRVGGPGLYAGFAFRMLGCDVNLVGPAGYSSLEALYVERLLGLTRSGYVIPGMGFVFFISYNSPDSRKHVKFVGELQAVDVVEVLEAFKDFNPNLVILSPIYGEVVESLALYVCAHITYCALDLQGYTRAGHVPESSWFRIVHVSSDDMSYEEVKRIKSRIIYYTRGLDYVSVLVEGKGYIVEGPETVISDPTGAGDIFTAIALYALYMGKDPIEAARIAVKRTPEVLARVREFLG